MHETNYKGRRLVVNGFKFNPNYLRKQNNPTPRFDAERDELRRSPPRCPPEQRISVKNLPYKMTDQELKDLFRDRVGDVSYVELYSDENGKVRQMWYLVYLVVKFKS